MYIPEVESLRGVAILLVVVYHADFLLHEGNLPGASPSGLAVSLPYAFVRAGHTGVSLFFILSGFLLAMPFLTEAAGGKRVARKTYYMRRALRILPLYYAAVAAATLILLRSPADLLHGIPYLFFLNALAGWARPLWPFSAAWWSLATEIQFYLILPALPLFLRSRTGRLCGVVLLTGYGMAYGQLLAGTLHMRSIEGEIALRVSLFGRAPLFLFGIVAASMYQRRGEDVRKRLAVLSWMRRGGADAMLLLVLVALGVLLRWVVFHGFWAAEGLHRHAWHLMEGVLWTSVLLAVLMTPLLFKSAISNRILATVGILSYSLYIVHVPVLKWSLDLWRASVDVHQSNPLGLAVVGSSLLLCLGISTLTYRFIERPFLVRKQRVD